MSWLTDYVRPRLSRLVGSKEAPDSVWTKCGKCDHMILVKDLEEAQHVCPFCDHHMRISADTRLKQLFDAGRFEAVALPSVPADPLGFKDQKKYTDRLKDSRAKTGEEDAIKVGFGAINGQPLVIAAFNFYFMGGSMGTAVGEGLIAAAEKAVKENAPLLAIPASGGARMQEGILSLMQLPRSIIAIEMVKEAGLPYLVLLSDPTTGGVTASFAMLGDVHLAEPSSIIGFAGARVIQETIREKLPEGFQRAEYLQKHGIVDMVVHRHDLRKTIGTLIDLARVNFRREALAFDKDNAAAKADSA